MKSAYLQLAKKHHPDLNQNDADAATSKFREVTEAWKYLSSNPAPADPSPSPSTAPRYHQYAQQHAYYNAYGGGDFYYDFSENARNPFSHSERTVNSYERFERLRTYFPKENISRFKKKVQRYLQGGNDRINDLAWAVRLIEEALQAEVRKAKKIGAFNVRFAALSRLFPGLDLSKYRGDVDAYLKGKDPMYYDVQWAKLAIERLLRNNNAGETQQKQPHPRRHRNNSNSNKAEKKEATTSTTTKKKKKNKRPSQRREFDPKLYRYAYPGHFYEEF